MKKSILSILALLIVLVIVAGVYHYFLSPIVYVMYGTSMEPTYHTGAKLAVSQDISSIKRGQVIVFNYHSKNGPTAELIKRVAGLPGETISIKNGKILINSVETVVSPITSVVDSPVGHSKGSPTDMPEVKLGTNEYFVLGDNTIQSLDSRYIGPINKSDITELITGII